MPQAPTPCRTSHTFHPLITSSSARGCCTNRPGRDEVPVTAATYLHVYFAGILNVDAAKPRRASFQSARTTPQCCHGSGDMRATNVFPVSALFENYLAFFGAIHCNISFVVQVVQVCGVSHPTTQHFVSGCEIYFI